MAYKREGFDMFDEMINEIKDDTARTIFIARVVGQNAPQREQVMKPTATAGADDGSAGPSEPVRTGQKVGPQRSLPLRQRLKV